eukprot:CAMPEP_0206509518 /NCGR_PEP_ID=MMETSP0324_2-20121206/58974_1 /ASSEMBLY_ACC=CAM_ASM_000836 /TAXON_ID=2866 /ORGANISM="Crypthecodinium cohnii, Strain Seligo" /LENGTH=44 /DNA_ID= /DNA_START= /DNA_END= /DNA_ORIENTATION=
MSPPSAGRVVDNVLAESASWSRPPDPPHPHPSITAPTDDVAAES